MKPTRPASSPERIELPVVIGTVEKELRSLLGPKIHLTVGVLASSLRAPVQMRASDVVDLLRHLVLDARDAMPGGGLVTVRSGRLRDPGECAAIIIHEVPDPFAMAPANATPPMRKGRSLGLNAAYATVERVGGHFHVSCRGRETVLTVCLPLLGRR